MDDPASRLPGHWLVERARLPAVNALSDVRSDVARALSHPLSSLPLTDLSGSGSTVTLVCADPTSRSADDGLIPAILRELEAAGVRDDDITLLIANEGRPPLTDAERRATLGDGVVNRYRVIEHDPANADELDDLGSIEGVSAQINRHAVEADLLVATGVVEPHSLAGFSGGTQVIALGCASERTQRDLQSVQFLDRPGARAGNVRDNDSQRVMREIGRRAGLLFVVNVVRVEGSVVAAHAGAPNAVHDELAEIARASSEAIVHRDDYNIAVVEVERGDTEHANVLYAASATVADIGNAQMPVLARNGIFIVTEVDRTSPNMQSDSYDAGHEHNFFVALMDGGDPGAALERMRYRGLLAGQERAYRLAKAVAEQGYQIIVAGARQPDVVRQCGLLPAVDLREACELAELMVDDRIRALIVPSRARLLRVDGDERSDGTDFADLAAQFDAIADDGIGR